MSKINLTINLGNGHEIAFNSDLGDEATPFEIVQTLDSFTMPSVVRALGLRTAEDDAALNAEAVDRANRILETARAAEAEATEAPTPEELKSNPRSREYVEDVPGELDGIPVEYLRSLDESQLSEAAKDKIKAADEEILIARERAEEKAYGERLAREDAADAAAVAPLNEEELPTAVELLASADGETRIKPKPGPGRTAK